MTDIGKDMQGGEVAEEQFYRCPAGHFWWVNRRGEWIGRPQSDFKLKLKAKGLCTTAMEGEKMSALEREFLLVSAENGVDYAGVIAGWKPGYYERDGTRYLISREIPPLSPSEDFESLRASCPNLFRLLIGLFNGKDDDGDFTRQLPLFLAWWRHAYQCLRDADSRNGLALVFAGDAGCGKTLLKEMIRFSFGGREAQPYRWFIGQEQFNGNLMSSPLWTVDDEQADTGIKARNHFGAKLKLTTANAGVPFRAMHRDELTLYPFRRIIICVNREPERLMVLPPLVGDVRDKMLILKCYCSRRIAALRHKTDAEKALFFTELKRELPHFLHWLTTIWQPRHPIAGRFGVPHYCHPEIERELFTLSPNQRLWDIICKHVRHQTIQGCNPVWSGGAMELRNGMLGEESALTRKEKESVPVHNWLGQKLMQLKEHYPDQLSHKRGHNTNIWTITLTNQEPEE